MRHTSCVCARAVRCCRCAFISPEPPRHTRSQSRHNIWLCFFPLLCFFHFSSLLLSNFIDLRGSSLSKWAFVPVSPRRALAIRTNTHRVKFVLVFAFHFYFMFVYFFVCRLMCRDAHTHRHVDANLTRTRRKKNPEHSNHFERKKISRNR